MSQNWMTPISLVHACNRRLGAHTIDLMADAESRKCERWIGPPGGIAIDFFATKPRDFRLNDRGWINPPFKVTALALAHALTLGRPFTANVLASVETEWFRDLVIPYADIYFLTPRVPYALPASELAERLASGKPMPTGFNRNTLALDYNRSDRRRRPCVWNWKTDEITEI